MNIWVIVVISSLMNFTNTIFYIRFRRRNNF